MPDALLQVTLASRSYVPVIVAPVVPPDDEVVTCPGSDTLQPLLPAAMVVVMAPDADTAPANVPTEPEMGAIVPCTAPLVIVNVSVPVRFEPSDWPPLQLPANCPSNRPAPLLAVNVPVTVLSALIVMEHGLVGPVQSPLQPVKADPDAGAAVMLTVVPSAYEEAAGVATTEPVPAPAFRSVSVRSCTCAGFSGHALVIMTTSNPAPAESAR